MKQLGLLTNCWLLLIGIICFTAATTTDIPICTPDMEFTKVDYNDITVTWDKECFGGDGTYKIDVSSNGKTCTKTGILCGGVPPMCQLIFGDLGCPFRLNPCSDVIFTIIGSINEDKIASKNISTAPDFGDAEWNLDGSIEKKNLYVTWNATDTDPSDVSCATNATINAIWPGQIDPISEWKDHLGPAQGNVSLTLPSSDCIQNITLEVTYNLGGVATEAKESTFILQDICPTTQYPSTYITDSSTHITDSNSTEPPSPKTKDLSGGEIAGIVIGSLAGFVILVGGIGSIVYYCCYKKKKLCFE